MFFHLKLPLELSKGAAGDIVKFLEKLEQCGRWPQQAWTTMFFLFPKNVTSERPIALQPTMIRWWEALRTPEALRWQQRYRVGWDATDGRNGGAEGTVWETLLEMESFYYRASENDPGATALVLDLADAFERGSAFQ